MKDNQFQLLATRLWEILERLPAKAKALDPLGAAYCSAELVIPPDSLWLVVVECRYNVIRVCASGRGFYIPGQEPCWAFSHVDEWVYQIIPPKRLALAPPTDDTKNL